MTKNQLSKKSTIWIGLSILLVVMVEIAFLRKGIPVDIIHTSSSESIERPVENASTLDQLASGSGVQSSIDTNLTVSELATQLVDNKLDRSSQHMKETLGIQKRKPGVHAIDVELVHSDACSALGIKSERVSVLYRYDSPTIRGSSMLKLRELVRNFDDCQDAVIQMTSLSSNADATDGDLTLRRLNELKYFFIRNSVPKAALIYPNDI